jgi:hypothetical protein
VKIPGGILDSDSTVIKKHSQNRKMIGFSLGVDVTTKKYAFSNSFSLKKIDTEIFNNSKIVTIVSAHESARSVRMGTDVQLKISAAAQAQIDKLAATFDPSGDATGAETYKKFIRFERYFLL